MPTTLTLKNIPDEVYERLKASAEKHRRSLNSEAIVCLESVLAPGCVDQGKIQSPRHRRDEARERSVIVVDTSILAYLYLDSEHTARAEALRRRT